MIIDSLTHILPTEVSSNLEKYKKIDLLFNELFDENTNVITEDDLIINMKKYNINKSVIAGFGWKDPGLAQLINDYLIEASKKYQGSLIPLCSLDINSKFSEAHNNPGASCPETTNPTPGADFSTSPCGFNYDIQRMQTCR